MCLINICIYSGEVFFVLVIQLFRFVQFVVGCKVFYGCYIFIVVVFVGCLEGVYVVKVGGMDVLGDFKYYGLCQKLNR